MTEDSRASQSEIFEALSLRCDEQKCLFVCKDAECMFEMETCTRAHIRRYKQTQTS